jgi:Raf kinase inhibitor-like YbhB/YbcL family protein
VALAGCGGSSSKTAPPRTATPTGKPQRISVTSPAFVAGGAIPRQYTCDGHDASPPLRWSGVPGNATELDLTMIDPDAPGGTFHHWAMRFPATVRELAVGEVPAGAVQGRNDFGSAGYRGPCPPPGPAHHYVIGLVAVAGHSVVASGTLIGTYARR